MKSHNHSHHQKSN